MTECIDAPRKRIPAHADLSPIKASPPASPLAQARKNTASNNRPEQRVPFGAIHSRNAGNASFAPQPRLAGKPSFKDLTKRHSKIGMLDELVNGPPGARKVHNKAWKDKENHVNQRVRDWERERERLREISRLEEIERERDAELSDSSDTDEPEVVDITPELEQMRVSSRADVNDRAQNKLKESSVPSTPATDGDWSREVGVNTSYSISRSIVITSEPSTPAATMNTTFLPGDLSRFLSL